MANIRINGANYNDVPRVDVPSQSGDVSSFYEVSGTLSVTENGLFDVKDKEKVDVNVAGSAGGLDVNEILSGAYWNNKNIVYSAAEPLKPYALANANLSSLRTTVCTDIGENALYQSGIKSFIGEKVVNIGYAAFYSSGLTEVELPECTELSSSCFSSCNNLEEVNVPLCNKIDSYALNNTKIRKFTSPCNYVDSNAFGNCSMLEVVDFSPNGTGCIEYSAFYRASIKALVLRGEETTPWRLNDVSAFDTTPIANGEGYIYVPKGTIEAYKVATNWTVYADQFRALEDYTVDGTITGELDSTKI